MDPSDPVPEIGLSWRMREHEARLLADSLRTSRLTLLYAGAGASRTALLRDGVVRLVARRETDVAGTVPESRVVAPFVDRRDPAAEAVERIVFFGRWQGDPVAALLEVLRNAFPADGDSDQAGQAHLADCLEAISERFGARLLIVLDGVEQLWAPGAGPTAPARFVDAFGQAVNRRGLRANFLLAVDDRCEGKLEALRRDIPRFDDSTVRLLGFEDGASAVAPLQRDDAAADPPPLHAASGPPVLSDAVPALVARPVVAPASRARRARPAKVPSAPSVPIKTDGVYAFIESTLTQTADVSEPWHGVSAAARSGASHLEVGRDIGRKRPARVDPSDRRASTTHPVPDRGAPAPSVEPPSPIDEWLDAAIGWCRRLLKAR